MEDFFEVVPKESELEPVFSRIERDRARTCRAIQTMNCLALDSREIDGVVEGTYHAVIAGSEDQPSVGVTSLNKFVPLGQTVFDVIKGRVDENARVIPCTRFYANGLMNEAVL